jgi:hypothetical protein
MTIAYPFTKDTPHVWLSGAVKTSSKKKRGYMLDANYKVSLQKDSLSGFDFHEEIEAILGRPIHAQVQPQ